MTSTPISQLTQYHLALYTAQLPKYRAQKAFLRNSNQSYDDDALSQISTDDEVSLNDFSNDTEFLDEISFNSMLVMMRIDDLKAGITHFPRDDDDE